MDIERLRQILKELNPLFWNDRINNKLKSECKTLMMKPYLRYIAALFDQPEPKVKLSKVKLSKKFSKKHGKRVPMILFPDCCQADTPEKLLFDGLENELKNCLSPYKKVYKELREEFPSPFA